MTPHMPQSKQKPDKPYPEFPLFPHATGRWAKKIRGKLHYFGPWDDPDAALQKYLDQRDDLQAGRTPRVQRDGLTIRDLVNRFLTAKRLLLASGELAQRTFHDYYATCETIVSAFGKTRLVNDVASEDFESLRANLAKGRGPVSLGNAIQRIRIVFKYGYDAGLLEKPVRYGPSFKRPSKKVLRQARHQNGERMFEAHQLRKLLNAAKQPLKAMVLLGINCAFGQSEIAGLPIAAFDFEAKFVDYPRPKTAVWRRCPLWDETADAVRDAIEKRPNPKNVADQDSVFITKYGYRWVRCSNGKKQAWTDAVGLEFGKRLRELKLKRHGVNFYALRHTFETIGGESRDQAAVDHIMGHARDDMASLYRERISDERLKAVTDYVHGWLFKEEDDAKKTQ